MQNQTFIRNYVAYNLWANQRMLQWLQTLDSAMLEQEAISSFGSISQTLKHIYLAQQYWILFTSNGDLSTFKWGLKDVPVEQVIQLLLDSTEVFHQHVFAYSEEALNEVLHLDTPWAKNNLSRYEYIVHAVNHGSYHRGQIVTIARMLGVKEGIPNTDYNFFRI